MTTTPLRDRELRIALGLALAPVIALGFSRFAYALLLPPMREDLGWTYTQAGGMNGANAIGYIAGAATAGWWARRHGTRTAFAAALAASAVLLTATALTSSYPALMVLRGAGGLSTAVTFVIGSSLAARLRGSLLPVYFAGVGIGVVVSGMVVPLALGHHAADHWQLGWLLLGIASFGAVAVASMAGRAVPGHGTQPAATVRLSELRRLGPTFFAYVLFGAGYVSYMTFVIALLHASHLAGWVPVAFWLVLGVASAALIAPWGRYLAVARGGRGSAAVSAVVLVGTLPILIHTGPATALLSALIFGSSFMAGPTAVTAICRHVLHPPVWTAGIAAMTTAFALGQAIGPVVSGVLSDSASGLRTGLWLSPGLLAAAIAVALLQEHHEHHSARPSEMATDLRRAA
jgi:predicted MFS family arabinose efflux permease